MQRRGRENAPGTRAIDTAVESKFWAELVLLKGGIFHVGTHRRQREWNFAQKQ